jgi:hypothetical protein
LRIEARSQYPVWWYKRLDVNIQFENRGEESISSLMI